jgi:outer membrane protein
MKHISALISSTALTAAAIALAAPALAQSKGDMTLGLGVAWINPTDDYSTTTAGGLRAKDNARPSLTFEYFIADRVGIEVLAAWPFEHDIELAGTGTVGKTKHLPPTVSLQYHFVNNSNFTPFVGLGINYTHFWDSKGTGVLAGTAISLDDSWGVAAHAGFDYALSDTTALRADVRWINIETKAKVGGAPVGTVDINPWVFGASYVFKF